MDQLMDGLLWNPIIRLYINIIDHRLDSGSASIFSMNTALSRHPAEHTAVLVCCRLLGGP
ncbi:hypothetical protein AQZ52_04530 [Novosphingobium fuchskuhlense]|uniref:Uncharacterized protein n=1 Tax=Novosphingobium fuchskuhlense TaxID=1117702 RepID=A0A124JVP9_9SPHN|nr:hypothetical protein AQZ52_04530 [Novosphingobium fuchskuhlense]